MKEKLPLSWQIDFTYQSILKKNFRNNFIWLITGKVASLKVIITFFDNFEKQKYLIRGCSFEHLSLFENRIPFSFFTGNEAILKTSFPHFEKKSLQELVKRGSKKVNFIEIPFDENVHKEFLIFLTQTRHSSKPQLQNLFLTNLEKSQRIFIAIDKNKNWQGLISITQNGKNKFHAELLHKSKNAPQGTIEFLIKSIFDKLKNEGIEEFSLGEVPFYNVQNHKLSSLEKLFFIVGRTINFAYNSKGLYNFKKKFNPFWEETYIFTNKKLNMIDLWYLMKCTNLLSLIKFQITRKILKLMPS